MVFYGQFEIERWSRVWLSTHIFSHGCRSPNNREPTTSRFTLRQKATSAVDSRCSTWAYRRRRACADRLRRDRRSFQSGRRNHGRCIDRSLHHTSDSHAPAHLRKRAQYIAGATIMIGRISNSRLSRERARTGCDVEFHDQRFTGTGSLKLTWSGDRPSICPLQLTCEHCPDDRGGIFSLFEISTPSVERCSDHRSSNRGPFYLLQG